MKNSKKWCIIFLIEFVFFMILVGGITIFIDPFFHYHKPISFLSYTLDSKYQRYQNDGIVKNFDYDAIIIGTSMTENFLTSEFDNLFDVNSIKVPLSGATYREVDELLQRAIESNDGICYVIRGLDYSYFFADKDDLNYGNYPTYLYNKNIFDDVKYIFNKEILFTNTLGVLTHTLSGGEMYNFDSYSNWSSIMAYGKDIVKLTYQRADVEQNKSGLTKDEIESIKAHAEQNILKTIKNNPQIEFYYFYTPYSIYYMDSINLNGSLLKHIEAEKFITSLILEYDNVSLFSFFDDIEMISDLNNYKDIAHYGGWINSKILRNMYYGVGKLTLENYEKYYEKIEKIYMNYDYDKLFE